MLRLRCTLRGGGGVLLCLHRTAQYRYPSGPERVLTRSLSRTPDSSRVALKLQTRLGVTLLVGVGLLGAWWWVEQEKQQRRRRQRVEQLRTVALGQGTFSLLDHTGHRRTNAVVSALDRDPALPRLQPLFITVDPERDDVAALASYVRDFHPRLVGLTGTPEEVRHAGRDFRVYASAGPKDEDGDYMVDHSVLLYLVSPDGLFLDYYNRTKSPEQIAESIRNHIRNHRNKSRPV
uniref:SCO cytochrome c oxidase assembly protein 1 n=1 Tax=Poecilia mexicana TaxID=48701 RepID=A0A3B3Z360_9TELE